MKDPIAEGWRLYCEMALPPDVDEELRGEFKKIFFAGAQTLGTAQLSGFGEAAAAELAADFALRTMGVKK